MEEVSNRTIAALLIVAMVISLSGTFLSLSKLNAVQSGSFTGFATNPAGTAKLNLTSTTSIKFDVQVINWSDGYLNGSINQNCNLSTTGYAGAYTSSCVNFASPKPGPLVIENDGNRNVNITVQAGQDPGTWIGGTAPSAAGAWIKSSDNESGSCVSNQLIASTAFTTSPLELCGNLTYVNTADTVNIDMLVSIPQNAAPGVKSVQVQANATAV